MPGFASGIDLLAFPAVTLANIQNAALADGMVLGAGAAVPPPPAAVIAPPANENHLVLIRYRPATPTRAPDYVFLREDSDRFWSYKPGLGLVTSIDTAGAIIQDPRVATMGAFTGVSQFLRTNKLTIDIGGDMICPF
ncbi:uncharacterized protein [Porites lutea]|uniref:uncharacterized protein n=1 Tax=Porites lutea TaxID=51062 RepID=UPI003CC522F5